MVAGLSPQPPTAGEPNGEQGQQGNQEDKAKLPHIGRFERWVRIASFPVSLTTAYYFVHTMSRNGIRDFFEEHKWFDEIKSDLKKNFSSSTDRKAISNVITTFDKAANQEMKDRGFKHTWDFFMATSRQKKLDIIVTAGAAFSIMIGLFAVIAEPRNRAAIARWGIFKRFFKRENEDEQKNKTAPAAHQQQEAHGTDTAQPSQPADIPALPAAHPMQNAQTPNPSLNAANALTDTSQQHALT